MARSRNNRCRAGRRAGTNTAQSNLTAYRFADGAAGSEGPGRGARRGMRAARRKAADRNAPSAGATSGGDRASGRRGQPPALSREEVMSLLHSWVLGGQQVTAVDLGWAGAGGCEHRPMTGNQLERFARATAPSRTLMTRRPGCGGGWPGDCRRTGPWPPRESPRRSPPPPGTGSSRLAQGPGLLREIC